MKLSITKDTLTPFLKSKIESFQKENLKRIMSVAANKQMNRTKLRFETKIGPDEKAWPDSLKARITGNRATVGKDRGELARSIDFTASENGFEVFTNTPYAKGFQFGGFFNLDSLNWSKYLDRFLKGRNFSNPRDGKQTSGKKLYSWLYRLRRIRVAPRPFMGFSKSDEIEIIKEIERDLIG